MERRAVFRVRNCSIEIVSCPETIYECRVVKERGRIHPLQVAYLLHTSNAIVLDENDREMSLHEFVSRFSNPSFWITFSTYVDLRKRGRRVEPGLLDNELVIEDRKLKIYVFEECVPIHIEKLMQLVDTSIRQGYKVVIAVVDMHGDVTYYEVDKMRFPTIERRV